MLFHKIYKTLLPILGTIAENTDDVRGISTLIYVKPTTATTTWDFYITDQDGEIIYYQKNKTGTFRDTVANLPLWRVHTITIANASANEIFKVKILLDERIR